MRKNIVKNHINTFDNCSYNIHLDATDEEKVMKKYSSKNGWRIKRSGPLVENGKADITQRHCILEREIEN